MEWPTAKRSRQGFEVFVATAADPLFRTAYLMTSDVGETEDLLQETFIKVARRWSRVYSMQHPLAYARRILVNLVLDGAPGRTRRHEELQYEGATPDMTDLRTVRVLSGIDDQSEFQWALGALTPRQRAILILRYWDDLTEAEVAEVLECPVGTVKSSTSRAVAELRRILGRDTEIAPADAASEVYKEGSC
jgi:RNA polymerase sigma-70 factor (sigma-E family)